MYIQTYLNYLYASTGVYLTTFTGK
jgi:hypothetical protein